MNMAGYVFFPTRESRIANRGGVGGGEGGYSIGDMYSISCIAVVV